MSRMSRLDPLYVSIENQKKLAKIEEAIYSTTSHQVVISKEYLGRGRRHRQAAVQFIYQTPKGNIH